MKKYLLILAMLGFVLYGCDKTPSDVDREDDDTAQTTPPNDDDQNPDNGQPGYETERPQFVITGDDMFTLPAKGGEFEVVLQTNIEYTVAIPEDAESWISVIDTRALRTEAVVFAVTENNSSEARSTTADFIDDLDNTIASVLIIQNSANTEEKDKDDVIPNNEIHYTSSDGKIVEPDNYWFGEGVNLVSNTYENGKGVMVFDNSVTEIGDYVFVQCTTLTSITIPNSVTDIGFAVFAYCYSLASITIPESVTEIGSYAFDSCTSLTSITIPDGVITIGKAAFGICNNLSEFSGKFASDDGRCLIVDGVLNSFAPAGLTEYSIPNSVTAIGEEAFFYYKSLTSIIIPESVTEIEDAAFCECSSLKSITIPNSVTEIGESAFTRCTNLSEFSGKFASDDGRCLIVDGVLNSFAPAGLMEYSIPYGVTAIGKYAFSWCTSLTNITIPSSVTEIGDAAFFRSSSLESVYCKALTPPNLEDYGAFSFNAFGRTIYVPYQHVESYRIAECWKNYAYAIVGYDFENGMEISDDNFEWEPVYSLKDPSKLLEYNSDTMSEDEFLHDSDGKRINGGLFTYDFWWEGEDDEVVLMHKKNTTIFRMDNWGGGVSIIFTILPDETVNVDGKAYHRLVTYKQYIGYDYNNTYGGIYISNPELVLYNDSAIETYPNYWDGQYTFHFNWLYHVATAYFADIYEETFVMAGYNSSR